MGRTLRVVTGDAVGLVAATTLASGVEFVEALTIVLAMGTTRGWRSTWAGVGAALAALAVITALAGYALQSWFPEALLQLVVGALLLVFGLQWLRKAILRAAGLKALHDEDDAFRAEVQAARAAGDERRLGLDWFAFVVSFKGVFLEGLEIVFIVITFGLNADSIALASVGAAIGGAIVIAAGFALHRPLARVPENTIKFAVGLLLSTFGTFWAVEGLGWFAPDDASLSWPGGDLALPVLLALWCALALTTVRVLAPRAREVA
jgi:Ca2+/H+ antiporter, TMEM165/GDT1 family